MEKEFWISSHGLFNLGVIFTLGCWFLALLFYPDHFSWEVPISYFGETENTLSSMFFMLSMGIQAFVFGLMIVYYIKKESPISIIAFFGFLGAIMAALPNDLYHWPHSIGVNLWGYMILFIIIIDIFELFGNFTKKSLLVILPIGFIAIFYTIAFYADVFYEQYLQKTALILAIFYIIWLHFQRKRKNPGL